MIITVGGIKGGSGKSLITTNLMVIRAHKNKKILLVDADDQGTSSDWSRHRMSLGVETPWTTVRLSDNSVRTEIQKMSKDYDDIIIDSGGRDTYSLRAALTISDIFLIPFQPKSFDIWTATKVSSLAVEAKVFNEKLKVLAFINCGGSKGNDNEETFNVLGEFKNLNILPIVVGQRKAFSNATAEGLGITELKTDPKAIQEIMSLHDIIFLSN